MTLPIVKRPFWLGKSQIRNLQSERYLFEIK